MKFLVTGAAGFIGSYLSAKLVASGEEVLGIDNLNSYYDANLKLARLKNLETQKNFRFIRADISNREEMAALFQKERFQRVVNLAAQAGVRYSTVNPHAYIESNLLGFLNILEGCRHNGVDHLIYASTSSVYGLNEKLPFSEHEDADHPVSLYGATKRANELMAHSYGHMYGLPTTGLRFFTVYGPWGRPDMALFLFTRSILEDKPIEVFNYGKHRRDFTYVEDIVEGVFRISIGPPAKASTQWNPQRPDPAISSAPFRVYNIGNNRPVELGRYIEVLENCLGKKAKRKDLPLQPGDVADTQANVDDLALDFGYRPTTTVEVGIRNFVDWYRKYYKV